MNRFPRLGSAFPLLILAVSLAGPAADTRAGTLFVNNRMGSDRYNGSTEKAINDSSGPVRTIQRALQLAGTSDIISLANTGVPYYESLTLCGTRHSGTERHPFTIVGNGSVLSGAIAVPETAWQQVGDHLWQLKPYRKGHYQLILNGKAVPELRRKANENRATVPDLPSGTWCAFRGAIYYRSERRTEPESMPFGFAQRGCGMTLYSVRNVLVQNVSIQHFRIDGVNAADQATDVVLTGVHLIENGRSGLAVGGTSLVAVVRGRVRGNRSHSVLLKEAAALVVRESEFDQPPVQQ